MFIVKERTWKTKACKSYVLYVCKYNRYDHVENARFYRFFMELETSIK